MLRSAECERVRLTTAVKLFSKNFTYMITIPQRHRQTDRQLATAIPRSARLRAVKTREHQRRYSHNDQPRPLAPL